MSYSIQQPTDGSFVILNGDDAVPDLILGGPGTPTATSPRYMSALVAKLPLGVLDTAGGVVSWANPHNYSIIISRVEVDATTKSTAACTLDIGTTATTATTSSDNLLDGLDVGTAAGIFDSVTDKGTNGKTRQKIASGKWVTASKASGAAAGLVGYIYIHYHPAS